MSIAEQTIRKGERVLGSGHQAPGFGSMDPFWHCVRPLVRPALWFLALSEVLGRHRLFGCHSERGSAPRNLLFCPTRTLDCLKAADASDKLRSSTRRLRWGRVPDS